MNRHEKYGREIFEYILSRLSPEDKSDVLRWHEAREDGVYLAPLSNIDQWGPFPTDLEVMTWHPYRDRFIAALPFPFTGRQLAVFCLPGSGSPLLDAYLITDTLDSQFESVGEEIIDAGKVGPNAHKAFDVLHAAHELLLRLQAAPLVQDQSCGGGVDAEKRLENTQIKWLLDGEPTRAEGDPVEGAARDPMPRQRAQEEQLLAALRDLGYDRMNLPAWRPGKPGVKAAVREKCPRMTEAVFDKAWKRLLAAGQIKGGGILRE